MLIEVRHGRESGALFGKAACAKRHPSALALISFPTLYTVS
jgi:hypothetical protein